MRKASSKEEESFIVSNPSKISAKKKIDHTYIKKCIYNETRKKTNNYN